MTGLAAFAGSKGSHLDRGQSRLAADLRDETHQGEMAGAAAGVVVSIALPSVRIARG